MNLCPKCGMLLAVADVRMLTRSISQTGTDAGAWKGRLGNDSAFVCPKCDAYTLGAEFILGVPFHTLAVGAWLTVNDWDWWNRDPGECDIRKWPAFGCLSFSEDALRTTVEFLREVDPNALSNTPPYPFDPELV